jgi:hypothetical protein
LERYLRENIDFQLDSENIAGLELYYKLSAEAGLIEHAKPIEFAAMKNSGDGSYSQGAETGKVSQSR